MERDFELSIKITEEMAEKFGINEDTLFDTYYEDGRLIVVAVPDDEDSNIDDDYIDCTSRDCESCEYFCPHCGNCIIEDDDEEDEDD